MADYAALLAKAGLVMRKRNAGQAFLSGSEQLGFSGEGARLTTAVDVGSALYEAGLDQDDRIVSIDGVNLSSREALNRVLRNHKPGGLVGIRFVRRSGETITASLVLEEDPRVEIVPIEEGRGTLSADQKAFREAWLGSKGM